MVMAASKRVIFSFDDRSLTNLEDLTNQGNFKSMGEAVRESVEVNQALQHHASEGFSEIIVRNPKTKEERVIVVPALRALPAGSK
jgi:hypothetical protein